MFLAHSSCDDWRRYKQLDHSGDDLLSCSALACRLHDFGLPDRKIEKLIYQARAAAAPCCFSQCDARESSGCAPSELTRAQMDLDYNGLISPGEFENGFKAYMKAVRKRPRVRLCCFN